MKLTGEWTCEVPQIGNIGNIVVSQVGCTATTTKEEVTFAISGHEVTFTGAMMNNQKATVNPSETKIQNNFVECIKISGN